MATRTVIVNYNPDKYLSFDPRNKEGSGFASLPMGYTTQSTILYEYPEQPDQTFQAHKEHSFCLYYDSTASSQGSLTLQVPNNFDNQKYMITSTDQVCDLITPFFAKEKEDDEERVVLQTLEIGINMAHEKKDRYFIVSGYSTNTYHKTACGEGGLEPTDTPTPQTQYYNVSKNQ